jgi:protein tyrosine phosphatase (PTP) superfamily phosphohydrolase (DUF442 family)
VGRRLLCAVPRACLLLCVGANASIRAGVVVGRALGLDPRVRGSGFLPIKNLRKVDDRLWAGAQAARDDYRQLADLGVRVVVDARTGSSADPRVDDPGFLKELGIGYESLPVADGHAPDPTTVNRFIDIVERSSGIVYMHCGGGVGRSTSLAAAYEASQGGSPSLLEQMAVGPMSLEQAWFIASASRGELLDVNVGVQWLSRYVVDAPRVLWGKLKHRLSFFP